MKSSKVYDACEFVKLQKFMRQIGLGNAPKVYGAIGLMYALKVYDAYWFGKAPKDHDAKRSA